MKPQIPRFQPRHMALAALLVVMAAAPATWAQSLWPRRDPQMVRLFVDQQAREVGDILTVLVREVTDVQSRDERNRDRKSSHAGGLAFDGAVGGIGGDADVDLGMSDDGSFGNSHETRLEREFVDRISVLVTDRYPNGNMKICGHRQQVVDGEVRQLQITGLVRPQDIRADNTIESRYIADFQMKYLNTGDGPKFGRRGWFGKIWQAVRP